MIDPNEVEHISGCRPVAREPVKASLAVPEEKPMAKVVADVRKESHDYTRVAWNLETKRDTLKKEIMGAGKDGKPISTAKARGVLRGTETLLRYLAPLVSEGTSPNYYGGMIKQIRADVEEAREKGLQNDVVAYGEFLALKDTLDLLEP